MEPPSGRSHQAANVGNYSGFPQSAEERGNSVSDQQSDPSPFLDWVLDHLGVSAAGVIAVLVVLGLLLGSLGGGGSPQDAAPTSTTFLSSATTRATTSTSPGTDNADVDRPDVDQLNCQTLINDDDADVALFGADATGPRGVFIFAGGETCKYVPDDETERFLQIEPGHPSDFEAGAEIGGVTGVDIDGVGAAARWFDDETAGSGVLSVGAQTELGAIIYRVTVGLPDLNGSARLEMATNLATLALPRFPGFVVEEPDPMSVTLVPAGAATENAGYLAHLTSQVDGGDWEMGEGLATILASFAGEANLDDLTLSADEPDATGGDIVELARDFVAAEPDSEWSGEIERLLGYLTPGPDRLEAMSAEDEVAAEPLLISADIVAADEDDTGPVDCETYFTTTSPCVTKITHPTLETNWPGKYALYVPLTGLGSWGADYRDVALESLLRSAQDYEKLVGSLKGTVDSAAMPKIQVFLTPFDQPHIHSDLQGGTCTVYVNQPLNDPAGVATYLRQMPAEEIARCFLRATFTDQPRAIDNESRWWYRGMARYLSARVYPDINLEYLTNVVLQSIELDSRLQNRYDTNWPFFAHVEDSSSIEAAFGMIGRLPVSLSGDIAEAWHPYNLVLTDTVLPDLGGGFVPYDPPQHELVIDRAGEVEMSPDPYGLIRASVVVPEGQTACVSYRKTGQGDVTTSLREGRRGLSPGFEVVGADWTSDLPDELEGESVLVVTSIRGNVSFIIDVEKVTDEDCEDEDEGDADGGGGDSGNFPGTGECSDFCDPSTYYWGPINFEML